MTPGTGPVEGAATPTWIRVAAAIAIVAFFVLSVTGLFGYYDWWMAASAVFVVAFGAVWAYKIFHDRDDTNDRIDGG